MDTMSNGSPGCSRISGKSQMIVYMATKKEVIKPSAHTSCEDLVNLLYSRPYSMTSKIFQNFCETQNTYDSYHYNDLSITTEKLNKVATSKVYLSKDSSNSIFIDPDLICNETIPNSPAPLYDSDDSVKDKDYNPSTDNSDTSSDDEPTESVGNAKPATSNETRSIILSIQPISSRSQRGDEPTESVGNAKPLTSNETRSMIFSSQPISSRNQRGYEPPESVGSARPSSVHQIRSKILSSQPILSRNQRHTIDSCPIRSEKYAWKRKMSVDETTVSFLHREGTSQDFSNPAATNVQPTSEDTTLQSAASKKRKKFATSLEQRITEKKTLKRCDYNVKPGCDQKCAKKCTTNMTDEDRKAINEAYWNMTRAEMRLFIRTSSSVVVPKRVIVNNPDKGKKRNFTLKKTDGTAVKVCKTFFLTTLGYNKKNDAILYTSKDVSKDIDKRGKHTKTPGCDQTLLSAHVESFQPLAPHYRREHAPNRRYLPNELNITFMHKDYCEKHPNNKVGYESYRKHLNSMNMSFTRLGNEECESCESYDLHKKATSHDVSGEIVSDCASCLAWAAHNERYKKARSLYDIHKSLKQDNEQIFFSGDLEKVIMLPRMDTYKAVIFCPRLSVYNQTFAPIGKITKDSKPIAVIWHDAIAGRMQEDIMSAYYAFLLRYRDVANIHIWLDNCTAQNKNWLLFSMLVHLVNSEIIAAKKITLHFFELGHTFMSCDQVHHQVELAMKNKKRIYDFTDFEDAVASVNNGRVVALSLKANDFINVPNYVSDRRIQNTTPRAYLKNMTEVCFQRGSHDLHYKNDFDDEYQVLQFMKDKYLKHPFLDITFRTIPKGIDAERKKKIISTISDIVPEHKMLFWKNIPSFTAAEPNEKGKKRNTKTL